MKLINEKVIAVFVLSMTTVISFSLFLSSMEKEDLQNALASVNLYQIEEEKQEEEKIDLAFEIGKKDRLTIRKKRYDEMTFAEVVQALSNGDLKMEYSKPYTYSSSRLTKSKGAIYFNGHKETYYSQNVLPGPSLRIPGRHVAEDGTVRDADGYISVAANTGYLSKGTVLITSLGPAKVYDSGCAYGVIDIYVNW